MLGKREREWLDLLNKRPRTETGPEFSSWLMQILAASETSRMNDRHQDARTDEDTLQSGANSGDTLSTSDSFRSKPTTSVKVQDTNVSSYSSSIETFCRTHRNGTNGSETQTESSDSSLDRRIEKCRMNSSNQTSILQENASNGSEDAFSSCGRSSRCSSTRAKSESHYTGTDIQFNDGASLSCYNDSSSDKSSTDNNI